MCGLIHRRAVVVFGMLLLFASAQRTVAQRHRDPCRLLTDAEVRAVQGHGPTQKIPSEQPAGSFRFTQCFYRAPELSSSVSVALGIPLISAAAVQFQGQVGLFRSKPCYRCFVGDAFDAVDCDNCAELGVLGALAATVGSFAALLAINSIVGVGEPPDSGRSVLLCL